MKAALAIAAAVVAAAVLALWLARRTDEPAADPAVDRARHLRGPHVAKITQADRGNAARDSSPLLSAEDTPAASLDAHPDARQPGRAATDYMVGGIRIRDHRSGDRTPSAVPPAIHPPGGRKIASHLTSDIAQQVRAVMTACAVSLPPDARGAEPRLDGTIEIAIKDRLATITSASVQLRDVNASAAAPVKRCIDQKSVGVATSAGEEADVAGYAIALSFRL
ncbi:MAG TPA: hypothetical protein VLM79_27085 [Kofleriaceae bacterium]|nr:hypothetical protein [Kofleriaceae bacterium]